MAPLTNIIATALLISYYTHTILVIGKQTYSKDCTPLRCSQEGPIVRFPFRLDTHAPHCGYDTLVLSCSGGNTVLNLPYSGDYNVTSIDYKTSILEITRYSWTLNCSWTQIAVPNVTGSLFVSPFLVDLSWFNCPDMLNSFSEDEYLAGPISCLRSEGRFMYVAWASTYNYAIPSTCTKITNSTLFTGPRISHRDWGYNPSSSSEFQQVIRDFAARPIVALSWHDELINCSMCENKRCNHCEFDLKTERSFCQESHIGLKALGLSIDATYLLFLTYASGIFMLVVICSTCIASLI